MLAEVIKARITVAQKTEQEWNASSIVLLAGEIGVASDTQVIKVGDGKTLWRNLMSHQGVKGDTGDPLLITKQTKLDNGDTQLDFSDGTTVVIPKGDKGERGEKGAKGDRGAKGEKGDPLTFDDLTPEQVNQIKAADVDLSNYATKEDLATVDVNDQLAGKQEKLIAGENITIDGNLISGTASYDDSELRDNIAGLRNEIDKALGHADDKAIHITSAERNTWNSKADGVHRHAIADITDLRAELDELDRNMKLTASAVQLNNHINNNTVHITSAERARWNNKADIGHTHSEYMLKGEAVTFNVVEMTESQYIDLWTKDPNTLYILKEG